MIEIVLQVSKQAFTAYGVCEVWKQELSTLIAIISRSASSWFSANYTIDQPGRFLFGKFQEDVHTADKTKQDSLVLTCRWCEPGIMFLVVTMRLNNMSGRHHILSSGSLQIDSVQSSDEGVYRCIAVNSVSNDRLPADNNVILRTRPRESYRHL